MKLRTILIALIATMLLVGLSGVGYADGLGKYKDTEKAVNDGYLPAEHCVPYMGVHWIRSDSIPGNGLDDTVKVGNPEVLVYAKTSSGLKLIGVEYLSTEQFSLFGQESGPGPAGTQALHAWLFTDAPSGQYHHVSGDVDENCNYIG